LEEAKKKGGGGGENGRREGKTVRQDTIESGERGCALRYKMEGRGVHRRWCHWNFPLT